jgi:hypothetical protein
MSTRIGAKPARVLGEVKGLVNAYAELDAENTRLTRMVGKLTRALRIAARENVRPHTSLTVMTHEAEVKFAEWLEAARK